MWYALKDFVLVETNLMRLHVPTTSTCLQCGKFKATTMYCLIFCAMICKDLKESCSWHLLKQCKLHDFHDIGERVYKEFSKFDFKI